MRVAKMPYLQVVKGKYRVRMVVPPELQPIIGKANLTKWLGTGNEPEANRLSVPWIAKFQETIDKAAGRTTVLEELRRLDMLSYPEFIQQAPTVLTNLDKPLNGWLYDIVGKPAGMAKTELITFDFIIEKWAANTNAPKRGKQDKTTKANRFAAWLGHNDMAKVTFEECRDYRDSLVKEAKDGKMSFTSAKQHMKHLKALFAFACDDIHIPADPMARVKLRFGGDGKKPADLTRGDRRLILTLARESGNPAIYWLNWLGSFEGARLCELAEADTRDIVMQDGIWIIGVKRVIRIAEQGAKTTRSPRDLPLHSAVLDAKPKFFDYVDYVKDKFGEGPPFPQFNLDGYGRRNGPAGSLISNWFRSVVLPTGKIAEKKSFESHRHTAISCVRNTLTPDGHPAVKPDVERYLFGHAPADVHARYGEQWTKTLKTAIENIPDPFL